MNEICQIYVISNNVNEKVYVGQTWRSLRLRFWKHCNDVGCPKINRAIIKYGKENFTIVPILSVWDQESANQFEIDFIQKFDSIKNGYNLKLGGDGGKHSEETKAKMSLAHKGSKRSAQACLNIAAGKMGEKNPMFGKPHSEEHKRTLSENMKGMMNGGSFQKGHSNSLGERHPQAKLNEEKVREIRRLLITGMPQSQVAALYGVSRGCILAVNTHRSWGHVT